eukprot:TRINITY_DN9509_c0_g4_i3.p3 TRINITY_DN9509_c0_g4~~TRINITY_DN9509_c0_g4_i3.p3  ORF type:complete len:149 (-),score=9.82 TRINITY_DN9509_c0_g4_i3:213-659(-)
MQNFMCWKVRQLGQGRLGKYRSVYKIAWARMQSLDSSDKLSKSPMKWERVCELIQIGDAESLAKLGRSEEQRKVYHAFKAKDFPYYLEEGIEHNVLWCTEPLMEEEIQQVLKSYCKDRETTYFVNPPHLQSIKGVWHAHVISRRRSGL